MNCNSIFASPSEFVNSVPIIAPNEFITIIRALLIGVPCSLKVAVYFAASIADTVFSFVSANFAFVDFPNLHKTPLLDLIAIVKKLLIFFSSNHLPNFK